jgi:hypothetical protein
MLIVKIHHAAIIQYTDKKENIIFIIYKDIQKESGAKSFMASSYFVKYLRISSIVGSPSSYMTLHPIPSEFPDIMYQEKIFFGG